MKDVNYPPTEHLHNFACWTAAAAVRRGFTTNAVVARAIKRANLIDLTKETFVTQEAYRRRHDEMCKALIKALVKEYSNNDQDKKRKFKERCTFGRAAKIIAIYMKTSVVIPGLKNRKKHVLLNIIFPPIDDILLKEIAIRKGLKSELRMYKWTLLNKKNYYKLKDQLESVKLDFNWTLEEFWWVDRNNEE